MLRILLNGLTAALTLVWLTPAQAQLQPEVMAAAIDCQRGVDPNLRLSGCTSVIESGQLEGHADILAKVYNNRGIANRELGSFAEAIADYGEAIRLNPQFAPTYFNRGLAFARLGQYERAIEDFDRTLSFNPVHGGAYHSRGLARCALGDADGTSADWVRVMEIGGEPAVRSVQEMLVDHGFYTGAVDGTFGPATLSALHAYVASEC